MRGSTHTHTITLDRPGALESGADDWEAPDISEPDPFTRPRLYKIAHSAQFCRRAGVEDFGLSSAHTASVDHSFATPSKLSLMDGLVACAARSLASLARP